MPNAIENAITISAERIQDVNGNLCHGVTFGSASGNGNVTHGLNGTPAFCGVQPSTATAASISCSGCTTSLCAVALGTTAAFNCIFSV